MRLLRLVPPTLLLLACSEPDGGQLGAFSIDLDRARPGLTVTHTSGLRLETAPGAFAFREARASYEMQFGSFLIEDRPAGDWVSATGLRKVRADGERLTAELVGEGGDVFGDLEVASVGDNLRITARARGSESRSRIRFACDPAEAGGFLGFGAHTHDVDHRGHVVPIWVSEQGIGKVDTFEPHDVWFLVGTRHQSYLPVPTMLAPRAEASYGLHATTFYRSLWDLCATDPGVLGVEIWEGTAELLVSPGPSPLEVVAQQTAVNGRIPIPPDWTFGVWMEAIGGTAAVRDEVALLRQEGIPASAIWSEDWRGAIQRGRSYILEEDWRWDQTYYPDLPGLIRDLHRQGMRFMTYFNTFLVQGVDVWQEAVDGDHLVKNRRGEPYMFQAPDFEETGLAELFREETRAWVKNELKTALDLGIDGWMADFAEWYPADRTTVTTGDGSDPEAAHNRYPLVWAEVNREAVEESGQRDVVIFHRSGYSGAQGKAHVIWAGDQRTSFATDDGLPTIVPILMGLSVTGFPVVTHDIAGYVSATNPPSTKELFFRWTSLGALAPVMRTHHGRDAALNWRWSSDEETIAHFKRWAELHTRLFPLFAGLGRDASASGAPILRPLAFADPGDVRLHGVMDAYLVGDALLVAPVVTEGATRRAVPLPRGTWYELASGRAHEGGGAIEAEAPLTELPIYARAGAVVPMLPEGVQALVPAAGLTTLDDVRGVREVAVWLGGSGRATDPSGGTFVLESGSRPSGALAAIEGAASVELSEAGHARARVGASGALVFVDAAGGRHAFEARGLPAGMELTVEARW